MADATPSRFGQVNGAGAADALFLKVFGGMVLARFMNSVIFSDKHMVRSISSGKSAAFPANGLTTSAYHTAGAEINGNVVNHNERVITIDDLLIAHTFIANIDEAKNHYDVKSIYSGELGDALAQTYDKNVAQVAVLAARAAATVTGGFGGSAITDADANTNGASLAGSMFEAAQKLDEKFIPDNDRYAFFRPAQYYLLVQTTNVINRDWGGQGVYADGKVLKVAGLSVVKTNNLPSTNVVTGPAAYQGDFSTTYGLVMHKSAVGTVKLLDVAMESAYDIRRQGTLMVAKYAVGHGILRPESAVEIKTA